MRNAGQFFAINGFGHDALFPQRVVASGGRAFQGSVAAPIRIPQFAIWQYAAPQATLSKGALAPEYILF